MAHPFKLGKYAIEGVVGSGAMGMVYRAVDPVIQRPVALKTIHRSLLDADDAAVSIAARFRNEAQAAGRLSHPGIVSIYEYGEEEQTAFIAMEYVEGQDLSKVLAATPALSEPVLLQVMDQLLAALDYAHQQGVWHRDIKPANLIVTRSGQLKITDFGIARIRDASLTQVTSTIGTHGYMAPEQYTGQDIDHRVDIFAAGVLLYRLLTGQPPYAGSPEAIMYKVLHEAPPLPSSQRVIPRTLMLDAVVAKAMARQAADRYASAGAFREALKLHAAKSRPASAPPDGEDTIVMSLPAHAPMVTPSGSGSGFDADTLSRLERSLASYVGPMAKLLVKQAAAAHSDLPGLVEAVAQHVPSAPDRALFLSRVAAGGSSATPVSPTPGSTSSGATTSGAGTASAMDDALVAHATRVLTSHMGPIAKVVVKKARAQSQDAEQFFALLVTHSAEGVDRVQLLKELQQGQPPV
ncbi:MAG: serine/threonine-protein kinase [Acidobacteriota bacterium]